MQQALYEKREEFRCRIRRAKLQPIFEDRRRLIIEQSDRAAKESVSEEERVKEEQFMMLRGLSQRLSQEEKVQLLARLPTMRGERQANLFKLLVLQKAVHPNLSSMVASIWTESEIVVDFTHCLREKMLLLDDNLTIEFILQRCQQADPKYSLSYLSLVKMLVPFLRAEHINVVVSILDRYLRQCPAAEVDCIRFLNVLVNRELGYSAAIFNMESMNQLFRQSGSSVEIFELCISVLINCPDDIQETIQHHPSIVESTEINMAVHASLDSRIAAYSSLKWFLSTTKEVEPYLHLMDNMNTRFDAEPSCVVKSKMLDAVMVLLSHPDRRASQYFLQNMPLIELAINCLLVRNSGFVSQVINIIKGAVLRQPNLKVNFLRYGLLYMLHQVEKEFRDSIIQQSEALRKILEQAQAESY